MGFLEGYARKLGVLEYLGTWNAATNTPSLSSGVGQKNGYYIVSASGTTALNGISDWDVGDWAVFNGTVWEQIDNQNPLLAFSATKEPTGHQDRTQSAVAFNEGTRTFSITPVSTGFNIWIAGIKQTITTTLSVQIPNTSGNYFFYIDVNGQLQYQASFDISLFEGKVYTGFVHWNATDGEAIVWGEERHGIVMDGATHSYLHLTRGTQLVSGGAITYTLGSGSAASDAQIGIGDLRIRDEDIQVNIAHAATPTASFQQILFPTAELPILYREGSEWRRSTATQYPVLTGVNRAKFNEYTGATWQLTEATANDKYLITYVFATTDFRAPVFGILGQAQYASLDEAKALGGWDQITFGDLPAQELKLLYLIYYKTSSTMANAAKAAIVDVSDARFTLDRQVSASSFNGDHSNLSGLSNDDHLQYLNNTRGDLRYQGQIDAKQPVGNYITALTGDVSASGPGSVAATLSNTGVIAGTYNSVTVDSKGRITSGSNTAPFARYVATNSAAATNATVTYTTVAQLTTASLPVGLYFFRFAGNMQSTQTQSGVGVRISPVTATITTISAKWNFSQGADGTAHDFEFDQVLTTTNVTSASVTTANANFAVNGMGVFRVTVAGTVAIQLRTEVAGQTATIQPDSALIVEFIV